MYNNGTGKIILVQDGKIESFWQISEMQRIELLTHNHLHKHYKIVDKVNQRILEEQRLQFEQQAVSPIEASRRAGERIREISENDEL